MFGVWNSLSVNRKIVVVAASIGVFVTVLAMTRLASSPSLTLLYSGLEPAASGDVVRSLEQRGVSFDVRGGAIFVDSAMRDELRMTLASEGLPTNSSGGYELLDNLSGFGTTSQMFDAAYWRAKEGELARTIVASSHISSARVHIANAGTNPFQRGVRPTASVAVSASGGTLSAEQAKALRYLVSSAVAGLAAEDVAIIGANGVILGAAEDQQAASSGEERSTVLKEKVERLLEARVGVGNAFVEVSIDTETEQKSVRERRFDPSGRVAISTDTEQQNDTSNQAGNGQVTVASNLPDGDAAGGEGSSSTNNLTRERINYEVSETETETLQGPGSVKRLTVAVLVNDQTVVTEAGIAETQPRSDEELQSLRELVSSAVGFDETRGDVITIKSMGLTPVEVQGTLVETSLLNQISLDIMSIIQMAVLAIVALILGLFVIRPVFSGASNNEQDGIGPIAIGNSENASGSSDSSGDLGALSDAESDLMLSADSAGGDLQFPELPMMGGLNSTAGSADRLKSMIEERQTETVEILRGWLENEEEPA
ncbi:MAG: flagellar basal-body MS-ring/collar protein FliF [Halioglobus sp.]